MQLKDPVKNRKVNTIPMPYQKSLTQQQLFPQNGSVDFKTLQMFYKREGKLQKKLYLQILKRTKNIIKNESNILKIEDPVTIVGDIHGQYYDFLKVIDEQTGGPLQKTKYLFLGDYVDRGLICAIKITYPDTISLLRGNHECRQLTAYFNFRQQCLAKYDQQVYDTIMDLFDNLSLAAIINSKFLCIHGGISTDLNTIEDIQKLDRTKQIPKAGLFCDLMWADPIDNDTGKLQGLTKPNQARGCSYFFGFQVTKKFLLKNKLISIIRAHEAQAQGFKMYHWGGKKQFPTVITIFSAPNYCDFYNNKGAIIKFKNNTLDIQQYNQNKHPYLLPNFMDVFEWSIPFVAQKVSELLYHLVKPDRKFDLKKDGVSFDTVDRAQFLAKVLNGQKELVEQNIDCISYNGRTLDKGLMKNENAKQYTQKKYKKNFDKKKEIDALNQVRPGNK